MRKRFKFGEVNLEETLGVPDNNSDRKESIPTENPNSYENIDEDLLEQFYSDEEAKVEYDGRETSDQVINKIGKQQTLITKSIEECIDSMDHNFDLLKNYL